MKSVIFSLGLAVFLVAGGIWHGNYVSEISENLIDKNTETRALLESEDFPSAQKNINDMMEYLSNKRFVLAMIADHSVIENIERNLAEMLSFAGENQKYDSLSKCDVLGVMVDRLGKSYRITSENIF